MDETFLLVKSLTKRFKSATGVLTDQLIPCHKSLRSLTGACNLSRLRQQVPCVRRQVSGARCHVPGASCQVHLKRDLYKSAPPTHDQKQVGGSYMRCIKRKPKKCHHVLLVCDIITLTTLQCLQIVPSISYIKLGRNICQISFVPKKEPVKAEKMPYVTKNFNVTLTNLGDAMLEMCKRVEEMECHFYATVDIVHATLSIRR